MALFHSRYSSDERSGPMLLSVITEDGSIQEAVLYRITTPISNILASVRSTAQRTKKPRPSVRSTAQRTKKRRRSFGMFIATSKVLNAARGRMTKGNSEGL